MSFDAFVHPGKCASTNLYSMSLAATLRPSNLPFASSLPTRVYGHTSNEKTIPFRHDSNYLALSRMLTRYQNLILLIPSPVPLVTSVESSATDDLTPFQRQIQAELYSPLPYHRTKWLQNVQAARNLLLQLERQAQSIKVQRNKKDILNDLSEKRTIIKRLRNRIEEIGRDVESMGEQARTRVVETSKIDAELLGERADEILARKNQQSSKGTAQDADLTEGAPVKQIEQESKPPLDTAEQRNALFESSLRRRGGRDQDTTDSKPSMPTSSSKGQSSGFSNLQETEKTLQKSTRTHEDLTSSLVSMAAQLKQQTRAFEFSLNQDKNLIDRAIEGLDRNVSAMDLASRNMTYLKRMSEGEGFFGRLKLYAIIFGMWVFAILLVFVLPKLRF